MVNLNNLFFIIEKKGLSASKVSADTGISTGNISDWKKGRSMPTAIKLDILANYLDCSVDYLLGRTDNPNILTESYIGGDNNGVQAIKNGTVTIRQSTERNHNCNEIEAILDKLSRADQLRAIADMIELLEEKYQKN